MINKELFTENQISTGIVLGVRRKQLAEGNWTPLNSEQFQLDARTFARAYGLGINWILADMGATVPTLPKLPIGIAVCGPGGDINGRMVGFLRKSLMKFDQAAALFRPSHSNGWCLLSGDHRASDIGSFRLQQISTLVSLLLSQSDFETVNLSSFNEFDIEIAPEAGFFQKWREKISANVKQSAL